MNAPRPRRDLRQPRRAPPGGRPRPPGALLPHPRPGAARRRARGAGRAGPQALTGREAGCDTMSGVTPTRDEEQPIRDLSAELPDGWTAATPGPDDAAELTGLLRRHEDFGRGWAGASEEDLLVDISPQDDLTRENVVLRGPEGTIIGWSSAHDRAAGRMLLVTVVDRRLDDETADRVADLLFSWAERVAEVIGRRRGLDVQQIDSGAFADDDRQHRWLERAGFTQVRTWWQMTRPVRAGRGRPRRGGQAGRPDPARGAAGQRDAGRGRPAHGPRDPRERLRRPLQLPRGDLRRVRLAGCARTRATGGTTGGSPSSSTTTARRSRPVPWSVPSRRARATRRPAATWSTSASCRTPAGAAWPSRC